MEQVFEEPCDAYYKIFTDKDTAYKYRFLSPFEFKNTLIKYATKKAGNSSNILDAGRGNPNFFSTLPRYGFALLNHIATSIGEQESNTMGIGFIPQKKGIGKRFDRILWSVRSLPEAHFLKLAITKMRRLSGMDKDTFIYDLVTSCLGCFYPDPPRIQTFAEPVLTEFLDKIVYRPVTPLKNKIKIFPTEGSSAAIIYIFNSLKYNGLVIPNDKIGIITPIFSPYLEFPTLRNYDLKQICVKSDANNDWEIPDEQLEQIANPDMRALFLVNPANPSSVSLSAATVRRIANIVKTSNPNLIIISDNVYAPFVTQFNSLFNALPRNTIGIYSFSKYFGSTGWRLGAIAMHDSNIIDSKLLKHAPPDVNNRYTMISVHPEKIKFIDRLLIDSRQVAEAHTAGLSTPQQTMMCLFAIHDLLDTEMEYNKEIKNLLAVRMENLLSPISYETPENELHSNYYIIINLVKAVNNLLGGAEFGNYLTDHRDPLEFLIRLAKDYATVLLPAVGFAGPFWGIRVSLANLDTESYELIGQNIRSLIDEYYIEFKAWEEKQKKTEAKKKKK